MTEKPDKITDETVVGARNVNSVLIPIQARQLHPWARRAIESHDELLETAVEAWDYLCNRIRSRHGDEVYERLERAIEATGFLDITPHTENTKS